MARYLLSSLATRLKSCLTGQLQRPIENSLSFKPTANLHSHTSAFYSSFSCTCPTTLFQSKLNESNILKLPTRNVFKFTRTILKFNYRNGTKSSAHGVTDRFFRLHWGAWIRCKAGRKRKLWTKSLARRNRLEQHVFCSARQCKMLDTMVTDYWKRPKYYIEDPYAPYHMRNEFGPTRKKPWRPEGVDYE